MIAVMNPIVDYLFGNKYNTDNREPIASFIFQDVEVEVLAPQMGLWLQLYIVRAVVDSFVLQNGLAYKLPIHSLTSQSWP